MTDNIKPIAPAMRQIIMKSIAEFVNNTETNKLYHLLSAIDQLQEYIKVNFGIETLKEQFNKELEIINNKKIRNYRLAQKYLLIARKKMAYVQGIAQKKESKEKKEKEDKQMLIAKAISPYQQELYTIFMILMKISSIQNTPIDRELLRSPETSRFLRKSNEIKNKINTL